MTVSAYLFVRATTNVAVVEESGDLAEQVYDVTAGSSWLGMLTVLFMKMPGPTLVKAPSILLVIIVLVRTLGAGILTPIFSIMKADWIVIRLTIDLITNNSEPSGVWNWAFVLSMCWPTYVAARRVKELCQKKPVGEVAAVAPQPLTLNRTPSQKSIATTHCIRFRPEYRARCWRVQRP